MAGKTAILSVKILTDAREGQRGIDEYSSSLDRFEGRVNRLAAPAAVAGAAVVALGKEAADSASALEQSSGAVASVFKGYADQVTAYAESAAQNVGLAQTQYQELATVLGSQLKNMGVPMEEVAGQTNDLIGLGADLAATFGGTTSQAVEALSSLMRGERDPIEQYGVSINQAAIDAQLASMNMDGLTGAAARNAETQATLALLTQQTADAQGAFARETDTAAGSAQIAAAEAENAKAALGEALLPAITRVTQELTKLVRWLGENSDAVLVAIGVIGTFAAGVLAANAALKIYRGTVLIVTAVTKAWRLAQLALNLALLANPVGIVIAAIAALVAIVVLAYQKSETFRNIVDSVWEALKEGIDIVSDAFSTLIGWIRDAIGWISDLFSFQVPGWVSDLGGILGFEATAELGSAATDDTATATSRLVAPARFARSTGTAANTAGPGNAAAGHTFIIQGAIDPGATARQIKKILTDEGRRVGAYTMGERALGW